MNIKLYQLLCGCNSLRRAALIVFKHELDVSSMGRELVAGKFEPLSNELTISGKLA